MHSSFRCSPDCSSRANYLNLEQHELVLLKGMLVLVCSFTEYRPAALKRQIALGLLAVNYFALGVLSWCCIIVVVV